MILGITGKIGSGKHIAAKILKKKGFFLIDADKMAHDLYLRGSRIWHEIVDLFGKKVLEKNYEIDRKKLGKLVFTDKNKLKQLNGIVHPALKEELKKRVVSLLNQGQDKIVIVAALAEELNLKTLVDQVVLIKTSLEKRVQFLEKNRGMTKKEILLRNDVQNKIKSCDVKISNEGTLEELNLQIMRILPDA